MKLPWLAWVFILGLVVNEVWGPVWEVVVGAGKAFIRFGVGG